MCLTPMLFGKAIDEITLVITSGVNILDTNFFFYLIVASVLIVLVLIFEFFFEYLNSLFVEKITKDLRNDVFIKLNNVPISYIDSHPHGDLVSRVINDTFNYEEEAINAFKEENSKLYEVGRKAQFAGSLTNPLTRLVNNSTYAIVGMVAAVLCALSFDSGNIILGASCTVGTILTFIQYSNQFAKPFNEISSCITEIQTGFSSLKRLTNLRLKK